MQEGLRIKQNFLEISGEISKAAHLMVQCLKENKKILICGNGGSAADSQHLAAELMGRYERKRKALPAIALSTDTSFLTAWANDFEYETVFERQLEALGQTGDI